MSSRVFRVLFVSAALAAALPAQPASQAYLNAYAEWRKLDPTLERDAATAGPQGSDRVIRSFVAMTKYTLARSDYLRSLADESGQFLLWMQNSATGGEIDLAPAKDVQGLVTSITERVTRDIAIYAKDNDRGLVQLRQALERERAALVELNRAIGARDKAWSQARDLLGSSEEVRERAMTRYQTLSASYSSVAMQAEQEGPFWAGYYQALSDALSRPVRPAPPAVTTGAGANTLVNPRVNPAGNTENATPVVIGGVRINNPAKPGSPPAAPPEIASAAPAVASVNAANPPARTGSVPPVPLARYTGQWAYPPNGGIFFGAQPESVDLEVHEENGHLAGTLKGRFKAAAGTAPAVQLEFTGDLRATRNQVLALETADGAKGTIELIPGPAYNLLEVTFQTEPQAGKLRAGNFVLVKK